MSKKINLLFVMIIAAGTLLAQNQNFDLLPLSIMEKQQLATLPELKLPPQYANKDLPLEVDNSSLSYYPGIFLQGGLSCGQAAAIALGFGYEMCRARNQSGTNTANNFPTHFTWNWENGGFGYYGVSYYHSLEVLRLVGCPTTAIYGGTFDSGGGGRWMTGYDAYYNAMQNRIVNAWSIKTNTEEGILTLKNWINDHLDGSATGGVGFFYSQYQSPANTLAAGTPHAGEKVIISWGASANHGMNICGYSDEVKWDFNNDGQYTNNIDITGDGIVDVRDWEVGAFKMANTYSTPYYAWMMYRTLALATSSGGIWNNTVNVLEPEASYQPQLTYKINMYYTHRKRIKIRAGMSTDIMAAEPQYIIEYPIINYQGGDMGMQGGNEEAQKYLEFGLDVTPFLNYINPGSQVKFYFEIIEDDPDVWGNGQVISYSLMDYISGTTETPCASSNVDIVNNGKTQLTIVKTINYDDVNITTTVLPVANVYHEYSQQMQANGGTPPYRWEFDLDYNVQTSTSTVPSDITTSFSGSSIQLPFTVNYYGREYSKIYVSNDGYIDFSGEPYSLPYQHELMSTFMNRPCIAACMMDLNASVYYKLASDYVAIRWVSSGVIETAVKIYNTGQIELFYGTSGIPYDQVWISGISSGNQVNYNLFPYTSSPYLPANLKYSMQPQTLPEEFQLSPEGLLTGYPTQELLAYNLNFKVYDNNNLIDRKTIPVSTEGLIVSTEFHSDDNNMLEWGENAWVKLTLRNATSTPITNLDVSINSSNNQIVFTQQAQNDINIAPGQEIVFNTAFTFNTLFDFENEQLVPFHIYAVCDQSSWDIDLTETIYTALFENSDQWVDDNDNNRLDIGETADVHFTMLNSGGSEVGDLDFTISSNDPFITINTNTAHVDLLNSQQSSPAVFNITASDEAPIGYLAHLTMQVTGDHNYSATIPLMLTIGQIIEDWETGDLSSYEWELGGNVNWFVTDNNAYDGAYCLKSGVITHNQTSDLTIALEVIASGQISFYRAVSCENDANNNWDYLAFSIDGNEMGRWDGELDWEEVSYPVAAGVHVFHWQYRKDGSVNSFQDCAWIDNIVFPSIFDAPPLLVISHDSIVKHMNHDETDIDTIFIMNNGGGILDYSLEVLNVIPGTSSPRSIAGSTVSCNANSFITGDQVSWNFSIFNASTDNEWIKQIYFDFPSGFEVTSSTDITCPNGIMTTSGTTGNGVIISWFGEDGDGWGILHNNTTGTMTIEGNISEDFQGDMDIEYQLMGEGYGSEPHTINGAVSLVNLGPPIDWFAADPLNGQVIIGEIDTILVSFDTQGMEMGIYECMLKIYSEVDTVSLPVKLYVDMGVDVPVVDAANSINVFPNPSADRFYIEAGNSNEPVAIEISDITGRKLWQSNDWGGVQMVWVPDEGIQSGVYMLTIHTEGKTITKKLFYNR